MSAKDLIVNIEVVTKHGFHLVIACMLFTAAQPGNANAQAGRAITVDPSQPERAIERLQRDQQRGAPPALPNAIRTTPGLDRKPLFKLRAVEIRGVHSIPATDLSVAYQGFVGKTVSTADLSAITDKINDVYRDAGLHLSRAIIRPQNADGGKLAIDIIEGRIIEVKLRGTHANSAGVQQLLDPVSLETPSRRSTVERRLLLASDLPGVRIAETSLEEVGTASGRFRLIVDVESWSNYTSVAFDNRGTAAIGPYQLYYATNFNSAFAPGDTLGVALSTIPTETDELRFARILYSAPLSNDGARWSLLALHSDARPGDLRQQADTRDRADFAELRGTIAPLRSRDSSLWLSAAFSVGEYAERDVFGKVYADHLRVITGSLDYQKQDVFQGWNYLTVNVKQGLDALGASSGGDALLSRADASGEFTKIEAFYSHIQPLAGPWSVKLAAAGQWASRPLLASQQFYLGAAFGRGFFGLETSGDHAAAGSAELRFDQTLNGNFLKSYQLYGYVDHTEVWDVRNDFGTAKLTLAGAGVRFSLPDNLQATVELAAPSRYSTPLPQSRDARVFFGLSKAFKLCPGTLQMNCV